MTQPGHTETVFDLKINPSNKDLLATASYDGTMKFWDITTMKIINTIDTLRASEIALASKQHPIDHREKNILYSICWSSFKGSPKIATCNNKGVVMIFDYKKGKMDSFAIPSKSFSPIACIDWKQGKFGPQSLQ